MGRVFRMDDRVLVSSGTAVVRGKVITLPARPDRQGKLWYTVLLEQDGRGLLVEQAQLQKVEDGAGS